MTPVAQVGHHVETLVLSAAERQGIVAIVDGVQYQRAAATPHERVLSHRVAQALTDESLNRILHFAEDAAGPGGLLVEGLPTQPALPPTPPDGFGDEFESRLLVARAVTLFLSRLLGIPYREATEKRGRLIHNVVPVREGAHSQTNQSYSTTLSFHNDTVYDESLSFSRAAPDFLVLHCLRADPLGEAVTKLADARNLSDAIGPDDLSVLRSPAFRMRAPGTYVKENDLGPAEGWSDLCQVLSGPQEQPEITLAANGCRPEHQDGRRALRSLLEACEGTSTAVKLTPGSALLVNNRKSVHSRSEFRAFHDGKDRWLMRTYVRRATWDIRERLLDSRHGT